MSVLSGLLLWLHRSYVLAKSSRVEGKTLYCGVKALNMQILPFRTGFQKDKVDAHFVEISKCLMRLSLL